VLRAGFVDEAFVDVLDHTPAIMMVWQERFPPGDDRGNDDEDHDGDDGLWRNRWNHPRLSGFNYSLLGEGRFLDVVRQYPNFARFLLQVERQGSLDIADADDRAALRDIVEEWHEEQKASKRPPWAHSRS
jgi:hypothetical protein